MQRYKLIYRVSDQVSVGTLSAKDDNDAGSTALSIFLARGITPTAYLIEPFQSKEKVMHKETYPDPMVKYLTDAIHQMECDMDVLDVRIKNLRYDLEDNTKSYNDMLAVRAELQAFLDVKLIP